MNPAFDCPFDTAIEEMKNYIERYNHPAVLLDEAGKLVARNAPADFKTVPVRIGGSIKRILPSQGFAPYILMPLGEMRLIQIKTSEVSNVIIMRFRDYYYLGWMPSRLNLAKGVLNLKSAATGGNLSVIDYCMGNKLETPEEVRLLKQAASEQLRREMNLGRMLEIVTNCNVKQYTRFNPYRSAKTVCDIAEELMENGETVLLSKLSSVDYSCMGIEEDYCSALAAMVAFAAKNSLDKRLWVESRATGRIYRVSVSFKSGMVKEDLEKVISGTEVSGAGNESLLNAELLYIRCIAENGVWGFGVSESKTGDTVLELSVQLGATEAMPLAQPAVSERVSTLIKAQLSTVVVK